MAIHVKNIVVGEKVEERKTSTLSAIRAKGQRKVVTVNVIQANEQKQEEPPVVVTSKSLSELRDSNKQPSMVQPPITGRKPMSDWLKRKDSEYTNLLIEN